MLKYCIRQCVSLKHVDIIFNFNSLNAMNYWPALNMLCRLNHCGDGARRSQSVMQ